MDMSEVEASMASEEKNKGKKVQIGISHKLNKTLDEYKKYVNEGPGRKVSKIDLVDFIVNEFPRERLEKLRESRFKGKSKLEAILEKNWEEYQKSNGPISFNDYLDKEVTPKVEPKNRARTKKGRSNGSKEEVSLSR